MQEKMIVQCTLTELADLVNASVKQNLLEFTTQLHAPKNEVTFLTRKEVAHKYQVSLATIHSWINKGKLQSYKAGSRTRFKSNEVELLMKAKCK
jgi:excisionase family DNA binding protein